MLIYVVLEKLVRSAELAITSRAYVMIIFKMFVEVFFSWIIQRGGAATADMVIK
jgi:hypothetical protein